MTSNVKAGVLVLPGGRPKSEAPSRPWQLANLRIELLARSLRRRVGAGVEVRRVQYRLRGWNPRSLDALRDARIALDEMRGVVDDGLIVVVGHSMGGRVAAHLAAEGGVAAVAALAPWWPDDDGDLIPPGCRLLTLHGSADTWTDPAASRIQTLRAASRGVDAEWVEFPGAGHFLLRGYARWHGLTAEFAKAQWSERSQA
ncbi:alpha/beta fold hydrolase [Mycolicibacterium hodleri]|uniref:Alpha/beta fold hydrolase n=1 Tax=Mycolicibacterium hodleri TaxID=49897 RepID=A0A502DRM1_9MYCO|nr:alpha/beta fold hydrolase [Mycolicibacterium hodleri]TPG28038.1 alpha/beta fold hydrolase [Mycolicibacterium hodleri]